MKISGLKLINYWLSKYLFDLILSFIYSFYLLFIYSLNDKKNIFFENKFQKLIYKNNLKIKRKFFLTTFFISSSTLPFIYLISSLFWGFFIL